MNEENEGPEFGVCPIYLSACFRQLGAPDDTSVAWRVTLWFRSHRTRVGDANRPELLR